MPAPNSLAKIAKKLESLQVKAAKLNSEIAELSAFVAQEAQRTPAAEPAVPAKKAAAKAEAEPSAEPKKRGRPKAGVKPVVEEPAPAKRRGRPAKQPK